MGTAGVGGAEAWSRDSDKDNVNRTEQRQSDRFELRGALEKMVEKDAASGNYQKLVTERYINFLVKDAKGDEVHVLAQRLYDGLVSAGQAHKGYQQNQILDQVFTDIGLQDDIEEYLRPLEMGAMDGSPKFHAYANSKLAPGMFGRVNGLEREELKKEFAKKDTLSDSVFEIDEHHYSLAVTLLKKFVKDSVLSAEQTGAMLHVMHNDIFAAQNGKFHRYDVATRVEFDQLIREPMFRSKVDEFSAEDLTNYLRLYTFKALPKMHPELLLEEANLLLQDLADLKRAVGMNKHKNKEHVVLFHELASKLDAVVGATTKFRLSAGDRAVLTGMVNEGQETESVE